LKKIREYNSQTDTWSVREFPTQLDYAKFVSSQFKLPGEYNLKNTDVWCKVRDKYKKTGHYCDEVVNSKKYYSFWTEEAIKCIKGVIIDGIFIPGYYYFYLNFCPIGDMIKKRPEFVEVWDSDLHFFLYVEMCLIKGKHALVNKKRRWGLSYKVMSMATRDAYLLNNQTIKIITKQEPPLKGTWEFLDGYKSFLNEHTGWSRSFASDKFKLLDFRLKIKLGNKQVERGRKNVIKGIVTANSPSGGVGGACHPKGTQILTTLGFKNVEDITKQDLVIGKDGKPKKIKQLFTGVGDIYKVSFEKFEDLYVTENHRLHLICTDKNKKDYYEFTPIELKEKLNSEWFVHRHQSFRNNNITEFKEKKVLIDPYFLGAWLGDGYRQNIGFICNKTKDQELFDFLVNFDCNSKISYRRKEEKRYNDEMYNFSFSPNTSVNKKQPSDLLKGFIEYRLFYNKHIPNDYIYNSKEIRLQLLAGLIDTDGHLDTFRNRFQIGTSNKEFADQIAQLGMSLGCPIHIKKSFHKAHIVQGKNIIDTHNYVVTIRLNNIIIPTKLKRKQSKQLKNKLSTSKIKNIELIGKDNFYGFECEDHLYTVNDYQITHNSSLIFMEEAGINSTLDKTYEFIKPTLQIGGLTTGLIVVAGSVGELKECEPLRKFTYNPDDNDFLGVPDLTNPEKSVSLFIPVFWNYVHEIKDSEDNVIGHERCFDSDGNSNISRAIELIRENGLIQARKDPAAYALFKSQYPETLEDLYGARETNIFPIAILSKQSFALDDYKPITIDIIEDAEGKLTHSLISKPIVTDFPLKSQSYREGAICMVEPPINNPPPFLYFAGVDPVKTLQGVGESLMSVHIFQNFYVENNELKGGKLVAWYTGRNEDTQITFRKIRDLLNYYNAAAVVESDQSSFIDWMIADKQNYRHRLLKRSQVPILKDLIPNSSIGDEYGVRMNTGGTSSRVKDYMHTKIIDYVSDILSERILEDGTKIPVYGVERIKDAMLIKEMLNFNNKGNYDRIISFGLALLTAAVYESRQVIHKKSSFSEPEPIFINAHAEVPRFNTNTYKINVLTTKYNKIR